MTKKLKVIPPKYGHDRTCGLYKAITISMAGIAPLYLLISGIQYMLRPDVPKPYTCYMYRNNTYDYTIAEVTEIAPLYNGNKLIRYTAETMENNGHQVTENNFRLVEDFNNHYAKMDDCDRYSSLKLSRELTVVIKENVDLNIELDKAKKCK